MTLVDSHCHLDFPEFREDYSVVITKARAAGVTVMLSIATTIGSIPGIIRLCGKTPGLYCSVGMHPSEVVVGQSFNARKIAALCAGKKVVGIGETGLDYHYPGIDKTLQQKNFIEHIKAAQETQLPLIVHTRDADEDTVAILKDQMQVQPFKGLIHCFTASGWLAKECLALGLYISISGIITFKNATALQETVKQIPIERLLVETDSPYLAPVPYRGKRNEPAFVKYVAEALAILKGLSYNEVVEATGKNFYNLFSKVESM